MEIESSRRREGFGEIRLVWTQKKTWWPPRWPKKVQITMDLEGRGGANWVIMLSVSLLVEVGEEQDGES